MPIWPALDATDGTPPLQMYTALSSSPEEKATRLTIPEHAELGVPVPLSHNADGNWRKSKAKVLILNGLGRRLATFKSTKELLGVFADAVDAHQQALDKADILHRDVGPGSILITDEGRGALVDWDVDDTTRGISQSERTGTFQFLSARFVNLNYRAFESGPHSRLDDIESFFLALQWIVFRFVHHGMHPITLGIELYTRFDAALPGSHGRMICQGRLTNIWHSQWRSCENFEGILRDLLEDLAKVISVRYVPADDMQEAQAAYQYYQNQRQLGPAPSYATMAARYAILLKQLEDIDWFRDRLRQGADDPQCPTNDTSTPQAWERPVIGQKTLYI
ncbi:hypothetical protein JOM56_001535 [Amanita muscaria]